MHTIFESRAGAQASSLPYEWCKCSNSEAAVILIFFIFLALNLGTILLLVVAAIVCVAAEG